MVLDVLRWGQSLRVSQARLKAEARQRKAEEQALGLLEHQEVSERFGWEELHGLKVH